MSNPKDGQRKRTELGKQEKVKQELREEWVVMRGAGYKDTK